MSHESTDHHHGLSHVMSIPMLLGTFTALIVLTIVTVWSAQFNLGRADILVAMAIATVKASLVAVYFMHLRYDKPFNVLAFIFSLCFVALFLALTLMDSAQYEPAVEEYREDQRQDNSL